MAKFVHLSVVPHDPIMPAASPDTRRGLDGIEWMRRGLEKARPDYIVIAGSDHLCQFFVDEGRPWEVGKNFAFSAPMSTIRPVAKGHGSSGPIRPHVSGELKEDGDISDLIRDCAEQIACVSRFERLLSGDLIFTGTPAGVGAVKPGEVIDVTIKELEPFEVTIGEKGTDAA